MTTPVGTISLSDVNAELNLSPTALITMNDSAVRTLAGVGGSGTVISMNDLRGKSNRVAISLTISASTTNYDVYSNRGPTYSAGISDITVTINPDVTVYSSSTGSSAFSVPSSFNPGDTVTVINNGVIVGRGGNGGGGSGPPSNGNPGGGGGPGLNVQRPTTIQNFNRVAGGGGGGGGGGRVTRRTGPPDSPVETVGGGGGGGGVANGSGGAAGTVNYGASAGSPAPLTAGGGGGPSSFYLGPGAPGGSGGGYGSSGSAGTPGPSVGSPVAPGSSGGSGGATGAAVTGNPFITWNPTGTRSGPIS